MHESPRAASALLYYSAPWLLFSLFLSRLHTDPTPPGFSLLHTENHFPALETTVQEENWIYFFRFPVQLQNYVSAFSANPESIFSIQTFQSALMLSNQRDHPAYLFRTFFHDCADHNPVLLHAITKSVCSVPSGRYYLMRPVCQMSGCLKTDCHSAHGSVMFKDGSVIICTR